MNFTVNMLLTCILYCKAGPGFDQNYSHVQYVVSYHGYHICSRISSETP